MALIAKVEGEEEIRKNPPQELSEVEADPQLATASFFRLRASGAHGLDSSFGLGSGAGRSLLV